MTDALAEQLMEDVHTLRRVVRRRLRASRAAPALPGSQVELLKVVEAAPGVGVAAAARAMHLAGNTVSALVYQLVDAGYLRRETDPGDRRAARLHLTAAATARLGAWRIDRDRLVGDGLRRISPGDQASIEAALPALRRLAEVLASEGAPVPVTGADRG